MRAIMTFGLGLVVWSTSASAQEPGLYSLSLHINFPSYCESPDVADDNLGCFTIEPNYFTDPVRTGSGDVFVWVLVGGAYPENDDPGRASGIESLAFGVRYTEGITINDWALCTGGSEDPEGPGGGDRGTAWPGSNTGNAVTWADCYEVTDNPDGLTRVGYFSVDPYTSFGVIQLKGDPRLGYGVGIDCDGTQLILCSDVYGTADIEYMQSGSHACGSACSVPIESTTWRSLKGHF